LSKPTVFNLKSFEPDLDGIKPAINGHLCTQDDTMKLEFTTVQRRKIIDWNNPGQNNAHAGKANKRKDDLWQHTCFELFVTPTDSCTTAYREFNFAPDGQWNSYDFSDYRHQQQLAAIPETPDIIYSRSNPDTHLLSISFPLQALSPFPNTQLRFGVTVVIQYTDQSLDYYALTHCKQQPDFHLRNSFILEDPSIKSP